MFDLSGHAVLITGASRGIGFEIARQFLRQGASVLISGVASDETDRAGRDLQAEFPGEARPRVAALSGDVGDARHAADLVATATRAFGRLDHVVGNAGIDIIKPAIAYSAEEWDAILAVNLRGAFLVAQSAAKAWIAQGAPVGSITLTSSIAGSVGVAQLAPYAASKGGINQLARTLALEWAPHGIRVNAIAPGYVENVMDGVTVHAEPGAEAEIRRRTPLGRRATKEEIAAPFVFLASKAAGYITGAVLAVDGGYTAA